MLFIPAHIVPPSERVALKHNVEKELATKDKVIAELVAGYVRIDESSDLEMLDGDLAREIASNMLSKHRSNQ